MSGPEPRAARVTFAVLCAVAVLLVLAYVALVPGPRDLAPAEPVPAIHTESISTAPEGPLMLFGNGAPGESFGRVAAMPLPTSDPPSRRRYGEAGVRLIAPLSCVRLHYAAGVGVCMRADEGRLPVRYFADTFGSSFGRMHTIPLTGPPIRARVAPTGRRAALTVFETEHSYAHANFSTRTIIVDTTTGERIVDLEELAVERGGAPFWSIDFNFWGVTFGRDGDEFYATLKTGTQRYLVKGSIDARRAFVVRENVECPSLSPDGRWIVFKKPLERGIGWRLHVLDLETGGERALNQTQRSVDDQVDWFDEAHVVYHEAAPEGTGIWLLSIDGVSPSQLLVPYAYSPAVQH